MRILFSILLIAIMLSPIIFQIVCTTRKIRGKINVSIFMTFLWTLVLVIFATICTLVIYWGMLEFADNSEELTDMSGILFFVFFGIFTAFIISPAIGLIGQFIHYSVKKKEL